jgi:anti-sigma factor RsiW
MDHEAAIGMQAAERYVAGQLAAPDRDAFEEHFFSCPECAEEVRWEQIFAANARRAVRDEPSTEPSPQ